MDHEQVLASLLATAKLSKSDVVFAFLVGSRAWGTHTSSSDHDVMVVLHRLPAATSVHSRKCDFTLIDSAAFAREVQEGAFLPTLSLFCPANLILLCNEAQDAFLASLRKSVSLPRLRAWVSARSARDLEKARKFAGKAQWRAAVKILCHAVRMHILSNRIERLVEVVVGSNADPEGGGWPLLQDMACEPVDALVTRYTFTEHDFIEAKELFDSSCSWEIK